jgi:hypothetical protein
LYGYSTTFLNSIDLIALNYWRLMINEEEEEEEPTRCCLVFYYTYYRLNMFRAPLCASSGAHDYTADYNMVRLILRLLMV